MRKYWVLLFMEAATNLSPSFYLWILLFLGGGRTTSREDLQSSDCSEDSFSGELHHRFRVLWEGFSIRAFSWQRASVQWFWQLVRRAHHPRAHLYHLGLCFSLVQAAIVSGSSVYCTCCIPLSFLHIYTLRFQTGFPRGVLSRVMLTKNTCAHFHVC